MYIEENMLNRDKVFPESHKVSIKGFPQAGMPTKHFSYSYAVLNIIRLSASLI